MRVRQHRWLPPDGWEPPGPEDLPPGADLVLVFGAPSQLKSHESIEEIRRIYPKALVLGCSTAGEISDVRVLDDSLVVTEVSFEQTKVRGAELECGSMGGSYAAGRSLGERLRADDLRHLFVLCDGLTINGSDLVRGISSVLPEGVAVTGGLAGDGEQFQETFVFLESEPSRDRVAAVGFYGDALRVGYGSLGGWDPFGPFRLITRSDGNVLHELDGRSALSLYKRYLGEYAEDLPASGLLFPLSIRTSEGASEVVRTVLSVDESSESMTFAGDVPEGSHARFMKANFERLIDGATDAARACCSLAPSESPALAILISCVGRRMVLKQRVEEELESVREVLGDRPVLAGFYSYGEISPTAPGATCDLHNQTMTITTLSEAPLA